MQPGPHRRASTREVNEVTPARTASAGRGKPGRAAGGMLARAALVAAGLAMSACATLQTAGRPDSAGAGAAGAGAPSAAQHELDAGISLYDAGEYVNAIRSLLTAQAIWHAPIETRVAAQKYVAFSHCLLKRPLPCKASFIDLLRLKPDFELTAAEAGHPQWGTVFTQAQREAASPAAKGASARTTS